MKYPEQVALGQMGAKLSTTGGVTPPDGKAVIAIQQLASSGTVTATSEHDVDNEDICPDLSTFTLAQGITIYGRWSTVTTSANSSCMLYFG